MAKAKFDITTLELPPVATKPLYAGVGVTDLAVEMIRGTVADVQKRIVGYQKTVASTRVADLQAFPTKVQGSVMTVVDDNVSTVTDTYADLASRGEALVARVRKQESTKATVSSAKTTSAKVKTTRTQATKATKTTARKASSTASSAARKTATTAKKSAKPAQSSAKATTTAAKTTATKAAAATTDAAAKVGDKN